MYIVIEGQDATGKSTQVEMLADYFKKQGKKVATIHEPDGDLASANALREIVKNKKFNLEPASQVLLFTAARLELWEKVAKPILNSDGVVISARNWWSSLAYQGYGQGFPINEIINITNTFMPQDYVNPTHSVILTLDDNTRMQRKTNRDYDSETDFFESKPIDFQHIVDSAYLKIAKKFNIKTLDASPTPTEIQKNLKKLFSI